jgi:DNA (cytosine-5)-methyltransferase 1
MVRALPAKFSGQAVERYYILSTSDPYITKNEVDEVMQTVEQVRQSTGCQVIVNGLNHSLQYYLRLISDTKKFGSIESSMLM